MSSDQDCAPEVILLIISTYCVIFNTVLILSHGQELAFFWRALSWDILSGYSHQYSILKQILGSWNHMKWSWSEASRTSILIVKSPVICLLHYLLFLNITSMSLQNPASVGNHQLCSVHRKEGKCTEIPVWMVVVCRSFLRSIGNGHDLLMRKAWAEVDTVKMELFRKKQYFLLGLHSSNKDSEVPRIFCTAFLA